MDAQEVRGEYILTQPPVKNTVMEQSNFIRLLYSDGVVALNGLHIRARLHAARVEQYFNKYKCLVDVEKSEAGIAELVALERLVLLQSGPRGKTPVYRIADQLRLGAFKLFSDSPEACCDRRKCIYVLKMSGVWETDAEYGVTYKFMEVRPG